MHDRLDGRSPRIADGAYMHRRQRNAVMERDERLAMFVRDRLAEGWSPQQISGWLRSGAEAGLRTVAMETIYGFIYRAGQKADELWRYLSHAAAGRAVHCVPGLLVTPSKTAFPSTNARKT